VNEDYDGRQYVGIDLHRRRSVIVRMTPDGEQLGWVRCDNDPVALGLEPAKAGPDPEVVLGATYGWSWAVDVLQAAGAQVHLAHPLGVKGFAYRRAKNDAPCSTSGRPSSTPTGDRDQGSVRACLA
jgi:transposase